MRNWMLVGLLATALTAGCAGESPSTSESSAPPVSSSPPAASTESTETVKETPSPEKSESGSGEGPAKVSESDYKSLPGGLKYAVLKPGSGKEAGHAEVAVHYTGWLKDGTKFDSSRDRGEPIRFALGHGAVIPGWDQGIKGMKVGEQRQLVIPPALGYGEEGTPGGPIPPNATLIFDVELVDVGESHAH